MRAESRTAIRNAGFLLIQRGFHIAAGVLTAVLIPRAMGPATYGRYALLTSISTWFTLLSGLGAVSVMSRFVPQFVVRKDEQGLRKLVSNLLVLRTSNGALSAAGYFLLTTVWFRELDWVAIAFVGAAVMVRTGANLFFTLFLGLNQAVRWGMGELLRRWLALVFVFAGFIYGGLRGACLGWLVANIGVFIIGLWWARPYLMRSELRLDRTFLTPFVRVGASFAVGNIFIALTQRSGEALVRVAADSYVQVGYYGVAYGIYLTAAQVIWQVALAFTPF